MKAILTFHSIDASGSVISVSPNTFHAVVRWLASSRVPVVPLRTLIADHRLEKGIAITFDDAFANFGSAAWPVLREEGLPVTLFVPTGHVGATNQWDSVPGGRMPVLPLLGWDELGRLANEGVELGAHGRTHVDLRRLSEGQLSDEVHGSVEVLSRRTGRKPEGFAYPYGRHDDRVVRVACQACDWACTTTLRPLGEGEDRYRLPRLDAYFLHGPARITRFGTRGFAWYLAARARVRRMRGR